MPDERHAGHPTSAPYLVETVLKDVSDVVNSIDDVQEVMDRVVSLTSDLLRVRNCSLMMTSPDGLTLTMGAAHGLPREVVKNYRGAVGEGITGHVARTGKPLLIEDVEAHPLFARKSRKKYSTKSLLSVPLIFQQKTIGVLNVNNRHDNGVFTHSDELFLSVLANFVVIAIEKSHMRERVRETERYEADLRVAREIQESMLPRSLPAGRQWRFAAHNRPAREVAGDFFDAIAMPDDRVCVVIGDVCGKGVPAAVYMARVLGYFRVATHLQSGAGGIVSFVNDLLAPEWTDRTFVTAVVGIFDDARGTASFCSAGHQPPLRRSASGEVTAVAAGSGLPLGIEHGSAFETFETDARPGDTFVFYTDGITEATNAAGDMFRDVRLKETLRAHDGAAEEVAARIVGAMEEFVHDAPQSDDVTLVVVQRT